MKFRKEEIPLITTTLTCLRRQIMDLKDIRKVLTGVCVATLLSGAGFTFAGSGSG